MAAAAAAAAAAPDGQVGSGRAALLRAMAGHERLSAPALGAAQSCPVLLAHWAHAPPRRAASAAGNSSHAAVYACDGAVLAYV